MSDDVAERDRVKRDVGHDAHDAHDAMTPHVSGGSREAPLDVKLDVTLDLTLDDAPCGYVAFADDGTLVAVNRTLCELLGYARDELVGRSIESIFPVGTRIFYQTHFFPLVRLHGHAEEVFLMLRGKDGADIGVMANAVRRERSGECITECVLIQVRERRKFEEALIRAKKEAEEARAAAELQRHHVEEANALLERQALELELQQQHLEDQAEELRTLNENLVERTDELERQRAIADQANHAKSEFLAVMSHELRTPLNAIGGYVQLLEMGIHGPVTPAQSEALAKVSRSQRHLLNLVNDVLNLARVEAGRVDYALEQVTIREVVDAVLPMVEPQLDAQHLRFDVRVAPGVAAHADRQKVEQILLNLISNAVKFTPPDGTVSVDAAEDESDASRVILRVTDTGIGIAPAQLAEIFEPFVQVDASHTRRAQGTGLGLTISRDLARGMGGDLTATSEPGKGSAFTLTLPRFAAT